MNLSDIKTKLKQIMPGVELTYEVTMWGELVVTTNLISHECMPDDTQRLATADDSIEFDAFALGDEIMDMFPDGEFTDDQWSQVYITTGLFSAGDPEVFEPEDS
jgi:hypothetical protein